MVTRKNESRMTLLLACLPLALLLGCSAEPAPTASRAPERAAAKVCPPRTNGCGPVGFGFVVPDCPGAVIPVCFTSACNQHDRCCATCGKPKGDCDLRFFTGMLDLCQREAAWLGTRAVDCGLYARVYYKAVLKWGGGAYSNAQRAGCECAGRPVPKDAIAKALATPPVFDALYTDEDDDLLPDDWETEVGLDPSDAEDATLDYDEDGLSNLAEFFDDLDPFTPDDRAESSTALQNQGSLP